MVSSVRAMVAILVLELRTTLLYCQLLHLNAVHLTLLTLLGAVTPQLRQLPKYSRAILSTQEANLSRHLSLRGRFGFSMRKIFPRVIDNALSRPEQEEYLGCITSEEIPDFSQLKNIQK